MHNHARRQPALPSAHRDGQQADKRLPHLRRPKVELLQNVLAAAGDAVARKVGPPRELVDRESGEGPIKMRNISDCLGKQSSKKTRFRSE